MLPNAIAAGTSINRLLQGAWKADRTAIVFGEGTLTYAELDAWIHRIAERWRDVGIKAGDRVAILSQNSLEWLPTYLATAHIGAIAVPLNIMLPSVEQSEVVRRCAPRLIVVDERDEALNAQARLVAIQSPGGPEIPIVRVRIDQGDIRQWTDGGWAPRQDEAGTEAVVDAAPVAKMTDPLQIVYTSGTTGLPKGVVHTHETALWNCAQQTIDFMVSAEDTYMVAPSLCWAGGLHDLVFPTLGQGGTLIVMPSGATVTDYLDAIEARRPTMILLVPTLMKRLVATPDLVKRDLSSLRFVLSGGETLAPAVAERFAAAIPDVQLCQGYGMSEGPTIAVIQRPNEPKKPGSTGRPASFTELVVRGADGASVGPTVEGAVLFRSPASSVGYWNDDEATAKAASDDGWSITGDTGYLDEEGELHLLGREKDMYVSGGLNVYPAEVENALISHPAVREVAVVAVPDDVWGWIGHAHIVPEGKSPLASLEPSALQTWLVERVARYKVPKTWTIREEPLPRNASGKLVKTELTGG